jgi:seryl-tRNA synthetase
MSNTTPQQELETLKARERELQESVQKAAADRDAAKADATAAKADLEKLKDRLAAAEAKYAQLEKANELLANQVSQDGLPALDLGDFEEEAFQVVESVTTHSGPNVAGPDGKKVPRRLDLKRGDVVLVDGKPSEVEELQAHLGLLARVHAVDGTCLGELRALNAIR